MTYTGLTSLDTCSTLPLPQTKPDQKSISNPSETKKLNEIKDLYSVVELGSEEHIVVNSLVVTHIMCSEHSVVNHNDLLKSLVAPVDLFYKVYWGGIEAIVIVELVNLDLLQWESLYNSVKDRISHNGEAEGL